jgi:hypothetical protein
MGESSAAIEYDSFAPTGRRQRLPVLLLVVTAALMWGGVGGWVLRGWVNARSTEAAVIGQASEFPPGSMTVVVLDEGHFDPGLNRFRVGYLPDGSVVVDPTGLELSTALGRWYQHFPPSP